MVHTITKKNLRPQKYPSRVKGKVIATKSAQKVTILEGIDPITTKTKIEHRILAAMGSCFILVRPVICMA